MTVAIIKYNAGNIHSVASALRRVGIEPIITDDHAAIAAADKVIFPGVGEAATTMQYLREKGLDKVICSLTQPTLGICIGMQLMCDRSEEGNVKCLGIFKNTEVKKFISTQHEQKIPHMGWNNIQITPDCTFLPTTAANQYVYFVHSYYVPLNEHTVATTHYIQSFSAAMQYKNFYATQFHIEKSGSIGETILKHFLAL